MHLKRQKAAIKLPIPRKGTKYIARPMSNLQNSVSVVTAIRDMLKLAKNTKEVKKMIHEKQLKLNGKIIRDHKASISLFNLLQADKTYFLTLLPTKKFFFQLASDSSTRLCKITSKKLLKKNQIQFNCHDGTNLISDDKITIGDSVCLDLKNKIKKHLPLVKEKSVFILSGKYLGLNGIVESLNGNQANIKLKEKEKSAALSKQQLIAI